MERYVKGEFWEQEGRRRKKKDFFFSLLAELAEGFWKHRLMGCACHLSLIGSQEEEVHMEFQAVSRFHCCLLV